MSFASNQAVEPSNPVLAHRVAVLRHVAQVADPGVFGFPKPRHLYFTSSVLSLVFTATAHIVGAKTPVAFRSSWRTIESPRWDAIIDAAASLPLPRNT